MQLAFLPYFCYLPSWKTDHNITSSTELTRLHNAFTIGMTPKLFTIDTNLLFLFSPLFLHPKGKVWVAQSCLSLSNPMDCSPPGSSVHGILQASILEWVAVSPFRGPSWSRDRPQISRIAGRFFTIWATSEAPSTITDHLVYSHMPWYNLLHELLMLF